MIRCGYCRKERHAPLLPVIVLSRGKEIKTYAHYRCIAQWRKVSEIRIDESSLDEKQNDFLSKIRERALNQFTAWRSKKQKQCIDCGYPVSTVSERCNACAGTERGKRLAAPPKRCVCGEIIVRQATHCPTCSAIIRENKKITLHSQARTHSGNNS